MKILQVIHSVNPAGGGPAEQVKQMFQVLREMGHLTEALTLDAPESAWLRDIPIKVYALGPGAFKYGYSPKFVPWLRKHAKDYDAVIVNGIWQYSSFGVWRALHRQTTPYFVFLHGMLDPWFKYTYPLKHFKKWLYWPWGEYRVLRDAKAVLFTCEEERLLARKSFWLYKCKEAVVNLGVTMPSGDENTRRELFFNKFPELRDKRLILFLGRIHPKKGCDLLIKAFARVAKEEPLLHLVIAGPDQVGWQVKLQKLAQKLNISDRITWTGILSGEVKLGAVYSSEVFMLPSHQENFGIAVVEALACGVPVLISDKVNIWREIQYDGAGLVAADDSQSTTELLMKWLAMSYDEQQTMRQKAKNCFLKRFEISKAAQSLLDILAKNRAQLENPQSFMYRSM